MTKKGTPGLGVLFLTVFLDLLGFGLVIPLVQIYAQGYWGADEPNVLVVATGLSGCYSLAQFIFSPIWGSLSDRIGRRPVFLITIPLTALAYLLFGLAADHRVGLKLLGSGHAVVIAMLVARTFGGIVSANISTAFAYVADITTPENRSKGMGVIGAAFGLGFVFGPALGGMLVGEVKILSFDKNTLTPLVDGKIANDIQLGLPAYLAAALGFINIFWAISRLPESLPPEKRGAPRVSRFRAIADMFRDRRLAVLLIIVFLATFSFSHMEQSLALFLGAKTDLGGRAWTVRQIGEAFGVVGVMSALVQGGLIRRISKLYSERLLLLIGFIVMAAGFLMAGYYGWDGRSVAMLAFSGALIALGQGLANPSLQALVSRCAPQDAQGKAFGANQSMAALARVVGPVSTGQVMAFGLSMPLSVAAAGVALSFLILLISGVRAPEAAKT
ncbi:MAG: MFS transporter [Planctomycetes bacterium]|nr:MFS transporter [Planctomycetota bacterium]